MKHMMMFEAVLFVMGCNLVQSSKIQIKAIDKEQCFPVVLFVVVQCSSSD